MMECLPSGGWFSLGETFHHVTPTGMAYLYNSLVIVSLKAVVIVGLNNSSLTKSCVRVHPEIVVWICVTFDYKFNFTKYLRERVVDNVPINISPSDIFRTLLLTAIFHQNCTATFDCCEH